jgi:phosphoribosylformylglycinamidine synthase
LIAQVEVALKPELTDPEGAAVRQEAEAIGVRGLEDVRSVRVYVVRGDLSVEEVDRIASQLLADPVVDRYAVDAPVLDSGRPDLRIVQVVRKPGVMDPVETSTLKGIADMGLEADAVRTARKYYLIGSLGEDEARRIGERVLANDIIEHLILGGEKIHEIPEAARAPFERVEVPLLEADDDELARISREGVLSMNLAEMKTLQDYFRRLGRNPTDAELETLAQTWSEHCVHKTFRGIINYNGEIIDNLLKSTVMRVTRELDKPWCLSVFEDNSGVIAFDDDWGVAFKVETHNHPSALEPYGGAGTGIGGVIRDPMGTGMGAKPILNTDVFCFGPPDYPPEKLPKGTMHPRRLMRGVVAGVRDYGNRMGIPTANGAVFFDERYVGNCLVYCGNAALIPKDGCEKGARPGDRVVVVGGGTGRDGIHGATFSSVELHEETSSSHVQIGNPITEKKMLDVLLEARDRGLYTCITDCGAGGLSSAVGETAADCGVEVDLDTVPLKYEGLEYWEIWVSEAQERMVIAVPPEHERELHELCASENVSSTTIGRYTDTGRLVLRYQGTEVCNLDMDFLHNGVPRLERQAVWTEPTSREPELPARDDYGSDLKNILGSWNVCSKEWIIRQYDHEVQGGSALKPLVGVANDGPGDACIITPVLGSTRGLIMANGMNPKYGLIDPYPMAASAIDEALRNIIAVGGSLEQCALLDNFSWGNPDKPDRLGGLVRAARACYDVAVRYGTPFISGKDSLNNEYQVDGGTIAVPPSLLISAIAVMPDVTRAVSMDAKAAGDAVYVVGLTKNELGGSHYYHVHDELGRNVPEVDPELGLAVFRAMAKATADGLVRACHDCSEGGLAVAAAEMAFAGGLGMRLDLTAVPHTDDARTDAVLLFSESNSRLVVEVAPDGKDRFEAAMTGVPHARIGRVTDDDAFTVAGLGGRTVVDESIADLKEAWQAPLRW